MYLLLESTVNTPILSNLISFTKSQSSSNCSSVSPGKSNDDRGAQCNMCRSISNFLKQTLNITTIIATIHLLQNIVINMLQRNLSTYLQSFGSLTIISNNSSEKNVGYRYSMRIHSMPSTVVNSFNNVVNNGLPALRSIP